MSARSAIARPFKAFFRAFGFELVRKASFDVTTKSFYSPIPDFASLPEEMWQRARALEGVDLRIDAAAALLESDLAPYLTEYRPPRKPTGRPGDFHLENGLYESPDAELLYAMVRLAKPERIVELGSGYSTLVIADAAERNGRDERPPEYRGFDPFPARDVLGDRLATLGTLDDVPAERVPDEVFGSLGSGDVLFVDTTHTVKVGGDVDRIVNGVLPSLAPGVLVHFHDIFLPAEYPREWVVDEHRAWAEQYLLQAFLAFNSAWEVLLPAWALTKGNRPLVERLVPAAKGRSPGAFWIRRAR